MKRAIVIVLDGVGAGFAPDSHEFGDVGEPSTLRHVWDAAGGFSAPYLAEIGFLAAGGIPAAEIALHGLASLTDSPSHRLHDSPSHPLTPSLPLSSWARLQPLSKGGKDSVTGHWEMMGVVLGERFPTYPNGFPIPLLKEFEAAIGTQTLGNCPASGTEIIARLGKLHVETGFPIVYTSADSVFQIACHEAVVPVAQLYEWCLTARRLCVPPDGVQRVIARPFVGDPESGFTRTDNRKDFPMTPPRNLADEIGDVFGIGVVPELFGGRGFRQVRRTQNNAEHAEMLWGALETDARFIFANFEDTDMRYGHRNDPQGFARCLEEFDREVLGPLIGKLTPDDLLILTADHGNDPTDASTDHTREYVPGVAVGATAPGENPLGDIEGFATIGRTVAAHLGIAGYEGPILLD
ncbi:MAG: phosphopentomutase [Armatimonadetes bacterium]|nr:phosphopentomutase [Armatimonadota bacterium]